MITDLIIKDSALWQSQWNMASATARESNIHIGMVSEARVSKQGITKYVVEVVVAGATVPVVCTTLTRFGGFANYEEFGLRPYKNALSSVMPGTQNMPYELKVGDTVVVAFLNGNLSEGVILGGLPHPARKAKVLKKELAYSSEFNGVETTITKKGAYKITNKALLPTSLDMAIPGKKPLDPLYNALVGGSYFEISDTGSLTLNDNVLQSLVIDKTGKKTIIKSGACQIELQSSGVFNVKSTNLTISNTAKMAVSSLDIKVAATKSASLKAPKIAIGNGTFELIDGLVKLIDALGSLVVTSPTGPCSPLNGAPTWAQIMQIKTQLNAIKGSF